MKNSNFAFGLIFLIILVAACSQSQPSAPAQSAPQQTSSPASSGNVVSVTIKGFKFIPLDVVVKTGDTVVWTNEDSAPHTVESSDGTLKSDQLSKGDTFKFTFTKAGTYAYQCGIHPSMQGSVKVQ